MIQEFSKDAVTVKQGIDVGGVGQVLMQDKVFVSPTGAIRSKDADNVRYDLISPIGHRRLAETYAEGAKKYPPWNWLKGFPASNLLNHLERHIQLWKSGDTSEDHLAHAAWGLYTLMHFEETRPELIDLPSRQSVPIACQGMA